MDGKQLTNNTHQDLVQYYNIDIYEYSITIEEEIYYDNLMKDWEEWYNE